MNDFSRAPRVLVVEDDEDIAQALQRSLRMEGYDVRAAPDGPTALEHGRAFAPDLVILDLGLPGLDGLEVARSLRADDDVPILILTARDALESRVEGLDAGADDYLVKPFDLDELAARVRALLRRRAGRSQPVYTHDVLKLDPAAHEVFKDDLPIALIPREFALLHALIETPTRVFTRAELEEKLYGWGEEVGSNTIEVHVHSLRRKLGADQIVTVRGVGYRLKRQP
jgi:two-component system, OmpR family, response regulator QseB